jgi:hypothetical protein
MMFHQHTFNQAKIKITFAAALAFYIALLGLFGCKKDSPSEPDHQLNESAQDRSEINPTVTHGMLHFNAHGDFNAFIQSLKNKEADTTEIRNAYTALGVDVKAEYLPNLTDSPVCLRV